MSEKIKKVFLENLPTWENGTNKGKIKWKDTSGFVIKFIYNNIKGEIKIINHKYIVKSKRKRNLLTVSYNNSEKIIDADKLSEGKIGNILGIKTSDFKVEIGDIFKDENRDVIITDREYRIKNRPNGYIQNEKWYKYTCNKCGYTEGWIVENNLIGQECGCGVCCSTPKVVALGYNTIWDKARWMCDLGVSEEDAKTHMPCTHKRIIVTCPDCRREKNIITSDINRSKSIGCICGDGFPYPEKFMYSVLEQLNIDFETEVKFDWCRYIDFNDINKIKTGRYDFVLKNIYVNNKQVIIETDGGWHNKDNDLSGVKKEESEYVDFTKDKLAFKNGYIVIRIDCDKSELEFIKNNILNSKLNELVDLSIIDWLKCEEFALSNLVKKACNIKKSKPNITAKEISIIMKLSTTTISTYLKQGTKSGWCDYNAKEEIELGRKKTSLGKQVLIFKDNINLGLFSSCHELERKSKELFGIELDYSSISAVANGKQQNHKGFTFQYVENLSDDERIKYNINNIADENDISINM